jgi:hypothetical protein
LLFWQPVIVSRAMMISRLVVFITNDFKFMDQPIKIIRKNYLALPGLMYWVINLKKVNVRTGCVTVCSLLSVLSGVGRPAGGRCRVFLPGHFSRKAGLIKHQLVFMCWLWVSAQKPWQTYGTKRPVMQMLSNQIFAWC